MARKVIALLGSPQVTEERPAGETIYPGHLVEDNGTNTLKNTNAEVQVPKTFALERDELGTGIEGPYASGDYVKVGHFKTGDRVYAVIPSGQNISVGEFLETNGVGELVTLATGVAVAVAVQAVDNSTGAAADATLTPAARIAVEVL